MDYEKKYNEALERAKKQLDKAKVFDYKEEQIAYDIRTTAYAIFPELKESEDERIRKEILEYFQQFENEELRGVNISDWISWLEKQGEQKVSEYDIVKTIKERIIEHFDNHLIIDKCFSIGGLKDDILKIINEVKFAKQGEPTDILDDAVLDSNKDGLIADTIRCKIEEQGEQKPTDKEITIK